MNDEVRVRASKALWADQFCVACGRPFIFKERVGQLVEFIADHPKRPGWYPLSDRLHYDCAAAAANDLNTELRQASEPDP